MIRNKIKNVFYKTNDTNFPRSKRCGEFHVLEYMIENQKYKLITKLPEMPNLAIVSDGDGNDLTLEFIEYCGPENNFHGSKLTPFDLGFECLNILFDGKERTFGSREILYLDKKLKTSEES
jgi:hypothetical protein